MTRALLSPRDSKAFAQGLVAGALIVALLLIAALIASGGR